MKLTKYKASKLRSLIHIETQKTYSYQLSAAINFFFMPSNAVLRPLYQLRWFLAQPLQVRILPKWIPVLRPIPLLKDLPYITIGQVVLALPLLVLLFAGWSTSFVSPSVEESGNVASFALVATFLFVNKSNSIFTFLFGMSFERLVPFHNAASVVAIVISCLHGYVAFQYGDSSGDEGDDESEDDRRDLSGDSQFARTGPNANLWKFLWDGSENLTGSLIVVCMAVLFLTSFFRFFRHYNFDLWLWIHVLLSVGVIAFSIMHEATLLVIPLFWWILDLILRYILMTFCRFSGKAFLTKVTDDVVEIRFPRRNFHFEAGQFVRIAVPALGSLQFHACTISSAPFEEDVTLHFKVLGGWTRKLMELAEKKKNPQIRVLLEGPYGSCSMDLDNDKRYPMILAVGGGIGITPCRSLARQVLHEYESKQRELSKLHVVWSVRDEALVEALPITERHSNISDDVLEESIYCTRPNDIEHNGFSREISKGRPNLNALLRRLRAEALDKGVTNVAVVACGPSSLVETLKDLCRELSSNAFECGGVAFDFHEDIFAY